MTEKMKIYLDNCCYNRPYDDQSQLTTELETKAKLFIQDLILQGTLDMAWSYILDFENSKNPFPLKRNAIWKWKTLAVSDTNATPRILKLAENIRATGIKNADALHLACAIEMECDYFVSTDRRILRYQDPAIAVCDPIEFLRKWGGMPDDE